MVLRGIQQMVLVQQIVVKVTQDSHMVDAIQNILIMPGSMVRILIHLQLKIKSMYQRIFLQVNMSLDGVGMQKLLHKFGLHVLILQLCKKLRNKKNLAGAVEGYVRYTVKKINTSHNILYVCVDLNNRYFKNKNMIK